MSFTFAPGTVVGGVFVLDELLAQGGMGAVYAATQKGTGQRRALKVMHPHLVRDETARARFEKEAQVAGSLESDHVVDVIAYGVDDGEGIPYLAMELLQGEDLEHRVKARGPLSRDEVRVLAQQLGHAIAAAHAKGVVHRDLKPGNVFLAAPKRPGEPFTVKVLDFGIARVLADARMTLHGGLGSPLWMAPEQVQGGEITPQTDVWAFALVVFYALTGSTYWPVAEGAPAVAALGALARGVEAPATVRGRELRPEAPPLPPAFDAWFAKALAKEPSGRFSSMGEALQALGDALPPPEAKASRGSIAAGVGITLVALVGLALFLARRGPEGPPTKMVKLSEASFTMGSTDAADEKPPHAVAVAAFQMDPTEVTAGAYKRCVDEGKCTPAGATEGCNASDPERATHPANCVTLAQAEAYCAAQGKRLPTEEEWERAARGTAARTHAWGSDDPRGRVCWGRCDTKEGTCAVGTFPKGATPEGVLDLAGNVAEWTASRYCPYTTPSCTDERHVVRGGGYCAAKVEQLRASAREARKPGDKRAELGFRCVR